MILAGRWEYFDGSDTRPIPNDLSNITDAEKLDRKRWDREDVIAQCLLGQRLPNETAMDMEGFPTAEAQWSAVNELFTAKSVYTKADLHQAFLDMRCPKGGDVREYLTSLKMKRHELKAANVSVTDTEYQRTILQGIPDALSDYAAQTLCTLRLAVKYTGKPVDMSDVIDSVCEEADRTKTRRTLKEQSHGHGKGKKGGQTDEALAATTSERGNNNRSTNCRKKGKCNHCGIEGHWIRECRSKKREETAARNNQGGQAAQASSSSKPENKPVGSANTVTIDEYDSDDRGFWAVEEVEIHACHAEADPRIDDSDSDDEDEDLRAELEGSDVGLDWPDNEGEDWHTEDTAAAVISPDEVDTAPRTELYDSGASRHISPYKADFVSYTTLSPPLYLNAANQHKFPAIGKGTLVVKTPVNGRESVLSLYNALYAPSVGYTLVSLGALDEEGYMSHIGGGYLRLTSPSGELIANVACNASRLYKYERSPESAHAVELMSLMELHSRLGHISVASTRKLVENGAVKGIKLDPNAPETDCEACIFARATRIPVPKPRISVPALNFGDEIHTDVWGPARVTTAKGKRYFVTFTDDATRFTTIYLIPTKDKAFKYYKFFEAWAITQKHCTGIKVLRSDRGGEYLSEAFNEHLAAAGTARRLTVHDTPQLNGIAERLNRMLLERIRALRHLTGLPDFLWGEALHHATWLKNRTATRTLDNKTPFEALFGSPPDFSGLRRWGCHVWVHDDSGSKLDVRAREGRWLGFDVDSRAHRVYWPRLGTVTVERNVYFASAAPLEGEQLQIPIIGSEQTAAPDTPSTSNSLSPPISPVRSPSSPSPERAQEPDIPSRRSTRTRMPSRIVRDLQAGEGVVHSGTNAPRIAPGLQVPETFAEDPEEPGGVWTVDDGSPAMHEDFEGMEFIFVAETADAEALEPHTLAEAKRRPDWSSWEQAIKEELDTLKAAGTWRLEDAPPGVNIIGSKWVLKAKKDAAGNVVRYKARLVAQGFSQIGGIDYDDTYAPVAKLSSTRAVIAMANRLGMEMHQIDIKGAYLDGELNDNKILYMHHPPGYKVSDAGTRVLHLVKTLYGLKQSGRRWYQKLTSVFVMLGFKQCAVDQAVYYRAVTVKGELTVVVVHVDDCSIVATTIRLVEELKAGLREHFEVTDLGELHWMLGIEVKRDRPGQVVHLSQRAYIDAILRRYNLDDLKPLSTPMDHQVRLSSEQVPASAAECTMMRDVPYREAVGALNWAALATRPDIAFAVSAVARFAANPGPAHWEAVKRIFRYLKGTRDLWLTYGEASSPLEGYADADGSMSEDRRAISGYAFLIDGGAVSWSSKRQEIVSLSTTESEYVAATHGGKEALWLRSLISEVFSNITSPTTLFSDNQAAIALTRDNQYHPRTKHIDVRYHWIRWVVEKGSIRLIYCPTDDMVADVLTKALPSAKVKHFAASLGLRAK